MRKPKSTVAEVAQKPVASRITTEVQGAAVYTLNPPLFVAGEVHERVIVARKFGETHIFPTFGPIRVLSSAGSEYVPTALKPLGYELA